ncbi:conserved hypothetical protein [Neisseria gonorrhoeae]|nr:conserved hypothetical protein [Neisseria gonorrhoeae]SCW08591.1 conserved hypothetical protein [Neisseria gonorrhoeae]SCW14086.1 conserved hypothetical protein [Neisseria gonorrhoeae]SCW16210.1 conserved hypothetical protein [Neisseria gonorrhoeae]
MSNICQNHFHHIQNKTAAATALDDKMSFHCPSFRNAAFLGFKAPA